MTLVALNTGGLALQHSNHLWASPGGVRGQEMVRGSPPAINHHQSSSTHQPQSYQSLGTINRHQPQSYHLIFFTIFLDQTLAIRHHHVTTRSIQGPAQAPSNVVAKRTLPAASSNSAVKFTGKPASAPTNPTEPRNEEITSPCVHVYMYKYITKDIFVYICYMF